MAALLLLLAGIAGCDAPGMASSIPSGCTVAFGRAQLTALFAAFNTADRTKVLAMIAPPAGGRDGLEITPSLANFFAPGRNTGGIQVHSGAEVVAFMNDISGLAFGLVSPPAGSVGTNLQTGKDAYTGPGIALGPVMWGAIGDSRAAGRHVQVEGGGKALIACPSGTIERLLLSPSPA